MANPLVQYHILNLPFREDRKYAQLGALAVMGYPLENIHFHDAPSGYEYENIGLVCQAAAEDGFPVFLSYPVYEETKNAIACMWGTLRVMQKIVDGSSPYGYYNQDDNFLKVGPNQIHQDIQELENLKIAQLYWFIKKDKPGKKTVNGTYYEGVHATGDSGLILSQEGAQLFIDSFIKTPIWTEELVYEISKKNKNGIYCVVDEDSRILRLTYHWFKYKEDGIGSENIGKSPVLVNKNT